VAPGVDGGSTRGPRLRKERERESMRQDILDAARALYAAGGYMNVTMRHIADRIEYTAPAIYSYFPSRDAIFAALAEQGLKLLEVSTKATAVNPDPLGDLFDGYWRYYEFSKTHQEYFALIFVDPSVPPLDRELAESGFVRELSEEGPRQIRRCVDAGGLPPETEPELASRALWAAIHGAAVIRLWGRLGPEDEVDRLARTVLENAIGGLRAGGYASHTNPHLPRPAGRSAGRRHAK
jgi:AcrR family transcriptional regulator